ncbi:hypothetical protein [Acidicapsa ligni]|uniref:hypothetical protein n=1 Tax=Acidicapsa ligni TaxID=542300 RepID=UPI0021E0154D|nr:hypothetical protein [Acidicapsa ligni]
MLNRITVLTLLASASVALAQGAKPDAVDSHLNSPTTFPIVFTRTISASTAHAGDPVSAKTSQNVHLANGNVIPSGTVIEGHVLQTTAFSFDKTPYAKQKESTLSIHFDSMRLNGAVVPLSVSVRAMADPVTTWGARETNTNESDPFGDVTQIGGDQLNLHQTAVTNGDGDVVAYNKRDGVYAHLIANGRCDGSSVEVSVGIYSASACGLYGYVGVSAQELGSETNPSTLTLTSTRLSPKIWKQSTALLEVLPGDKMVASR